MLISLVLGWQTSFFAFLCLLPVFKLNLTEKIMETAFAHIVGGVHFEGARVGFLLKYKQKTKKDEPEKTKKYEAISSSFLAPSKWSPSTR